MADPDFWEYSNAFQRSHAIYIVIYGKARQAHLKPVGLQHHDRIPWNISGFVRASNLQKCFEIGVQDRPLPLGGKCMAGGSIGLCGMDLYV